MTEPSPSRLLVEGGWDSETWLVDDHWIERSPRRPEVAPRLRAECGLLPWLAERLPLPVPLPVVLGEDPLVVGHRLVPGEGSEHLDDAQGAAFGRFLRALHDADAEEAVRRGVLAREAAEEERRATLGRMRGGVLLELPADLQDRAGALLDRLQADPPRTTLVHGDLGPPHLLLDQGRAAGVIDWSDAHVGDPARDLSWLLFGSGAGPAVRLAYGADQTVVARAADWRALGPWFEVLHGIDTDQSTFVASGMEGIVTRLVDVP